MLMRRGQVRPLALIKSSDASCSHSGSQLHPDCHIDRTLTVAERMRLQSIPDGLPLKVRVAAMHTDEQNACAMLLRHMGISKRGCSCIQKAMHQDCRRVHGLCCGLLLQMKARPAALQGRYHMVMKAVGNAVPMLFGWAVLGSVFEAAYGTPAPRPACLNGRPPWEGESADPHAYVSCADVPHMRCI